MPPWINNRFIILGVSLVVLIGGWNVYVTAHAHGVVSGTVVDTAGRPLAGALVKLYQRDFVSQQEKARTMSEQDGRFRFDGNASHVVQLQAERDGVRSPRATIRLWFRAQDTTLPAPLVLR